MRLIKRSSRRWVACAVFAACAAPAFAQRPGGGAPGAPVQRLGPSRSQSAGIGSPGAPMGRISRSVGTPQATPAPARRSYAGIGGGVMSSQSFRAQSYVGQARGGGQRTAAGIVSGATRGMVTLPSNGR